MDEQRPPEYKALVIGVKGPPQDPCDESPPAWPQLPYAPGCADRVRTALDAFHYRPHTMGPDPAGSAVALQQAVESVLESGPGFIVVHLLAHGDPGESSGGVHVIGGDGQRTRDDIERWIKLVEEPAPGRPAPHVLFLLDLCHSGSAARLEWQHVMRPGRRRAWVIAASEIGQPAYDGRLSRAVAEVLTRFANETVRVDPSVPHIPLSLFCRQVTDLVKKYAENGPEQRTLSPLVPLDAVDDLSHLAFFPNPAYDRDATQSYALSQVDHAVIALLDEAADVRHFVHRASGAEALSRESNSGFFSGRETEVRSLSAWLRGDGHDLYVVTGKPGVGKSALLGVLVCAAHQVLRDEMRPLWQSLADPPPAVPDLAVVHARHRSVSDVMAALGRQWELGPTRTVAEVVSALHARDRPPVLILDALDEAAHPRELMAELLILAPACRILIGVRHERRFAPLFRRAGRRGRLALDRVPRRKLRGELRTYMRSVLVTDPRYNTADRERLVGQLVDGMARALVRRRTAQWGEFLVAALYMRHVLDQPVPEAPAQARQLIAEVPRSLRQVLDLHLASYRDTPWLLEVLTALAFAQGSGMPEEVVQAATAAVSTGEPKIEHIRDALYAARFFLRRDVDAEGRTLYRLFHQSLADILRAGPRHADAVFTRLLALVDTPRQWATAEPYLLRHVAQHAAEAGRLKELMNDPEFLVHANIEALKALLNPQPRGLLALRLPPRAKLYVDSADSLRNRLPAERRQILTIAAAKQGEEELAETLALGGLWRAYRIGRIPEHYESETNPFGDPVGGIYWPSKVTALLPVGLDGLPHLFAGAGDGEGRVWNLRERRLVEGVGERRWENVQDMAFTVLDGRPIGVSAQRYVDHHVFVSRISTWGLPDLSLVKESGEIFDQFLSGVACTTVRNNPVAVLCGCRIRRLRDDTGLLLLWDLREHRQLGEPLISDGAPLKCVAAATMGQRPHALTGGKDGTVRLWDLEAGTEVRTMTGHQGAVQCIAVAKVGERPHAVTGGRDGTVRLWDLEAGTEVRTMTGHQGAVQCIAVAKVGERPHAVTGGGRAMRVWDLLNGSGRKPLWLPKDPQRLAVATDGTLVIALADTLLALEPGPGHPPFQPLNPLSYP